MLGEPATVEEAALVEKLRKIEALFAQPERPVECRLSIPDPWARTLFIALLGSERSARGLACLDPCPAGSIFRADMGAEQ